MGLFDYFKKKDKKEIEKEMYPNGKFSIDGFLWLVENNMDVCESHYSCEEIEMINCKGRINYLHELSDNGRKLYGNDDDNYDYYG